MFNLEPGEITVVCLLAVAFCGPAKLSDLAEGLRTLKPARLESRWSWTDWLYVSAAVFFAATALLAWAARP